MICSFFVILHANEEAAGHCGQFFLHLFTFFFPCKNTIHKYPASDVMFNQFFNECMVKSMLLFSITFWLGTFTIDNHLYDTR